MSARLGRCQQLFQVHILHQCGRDGASVPFDAVEPENMPLNFLTMPVQISAKTRPSQGLGISQPDVIGPPKASGLSSAIFE
ncbi:hypothetical protein [Methylobacter sp. YRD-M1]|uniref:hypothetical protein n=1 Tax=Methylobacter sp. YRD-M1 TaxID=2911520 RepID=UPI00227AA73B|nr:hypothetical protein [Methylobacter sp. YRD-M1]WAK03989.1 hypothetical protein LZ558_09435 [Methylobacter sp. YRD-M1]